MFCGLRFGFECKYHRQKQAGMDGSKRGIQRRERRLMQYEPWVHSFLHTKGLQSHSQALSCVSGSLCQSMDCPVLFIQSSSICRPKKWALKGFLCLA